MREKEKERRSRMKRSKSWLVESRAESTSSSSRIASASASPHANWSLICSLALLTHRRKVKLNRRGNSAANFRGAQIYAPILKSKRDLQRPTLCSSEAGKKSKGSSFSTFLYGRARARAQRLKRNRSELQSSNEDRNSVEIRTASSKIRWCDRLLPYILIFYVWLCAASRATWLFAFPSILSPPLSLSLSLSLFFYRYRIIFVTHEQSIFALRAISGLLTRYIEKRSGCNSSIYLFASARFY